MPSLAAAYVEGARCQGSAQPTAKLLCRGVGIPVRAREDAPVEAADVHAG
jgi:hypothetical protein